MLEKEYLRTVYLQKRKILTFEEVADKSKYLLSVFIRSFDLTGVNMVHVFLPIKKQKEVDTWRFVSHIEQQNSKVIVSKSNVSTNEMSHYLYDQNLELKENTWGIPEPTSGIQVAELEIDMVLVPLVIFDKRGHRIGYGKGYYDNFLSKCKADCVKVGLSLVPPLDSIPNMEPTDVKLDYCISPMGLHTFGV